MTDQNLRTIYDYLTNNDLLMVDAVETVDNSENGYSNVFDNFDMWGEGLSDNGDYAVYQSNGSDIVFFLEESGMRSYVEDVLRGSEDPKEAMLHSLRDVAGPNYEQLYTEWSMPIKEIGDMKVSQFKTGSLDKKVVAMTIIKEAAGTGIGTYRRGKVLVDVKAVQPGQLIVWESIVFKAVNLVKVTETFDDKFYGIIVKPDNPVEKAKAADEEFVVYAHDLEKGEWYIALEPAPSDVAPAAKPTVKPEVTPEAEGTPAIAPVGAPEGKGDGKAMPSAEEAVVAPEGKGAGLKSPVRKTLDYGKIAAKSDRKYVFYFDESKPPEMWGEGLVKATIDGEDEDVNHALEEVMADLTEEFSLAGTAGSLYVGSAMLGDISFMVDYDLETAVKDLTEAGIETTSEEVEKQFEQEQEWLDKNTSILPLNKGMEVEKEVSMDESAKEASKTAGRYTNGFDIDFQEGKEGAKAVEGILHKYDCTIEDITPDLGNKVLNVAKKETMSPEDHQVLMQAEKEMDAYSRSASKKTVAYGEEPASCIEPRYDADQFRSREDYVSKEDETTTFGCYNIQSSTKEDEAVEKVEATTKPEEEDIFGFNDTMASMEPSTEGCGLSGDATSIAASLIANIEALSSAPGGEGDPGDAYDLLDGGRNFTGVDENMVEGSVHEYLNGKATSFASLEDFAGFVEDIYGIKEASKYIAEAWHNEDAKTIVAFIKQNAKKDELKY